MAKRFTKRTINWEELEKRVLPDERGKFFTFKAKSDGYLRKVLANPAEMPKINWEDYAKKIPAPILLKTFKNEYESFKVPYPEDKLSSSVDKQWATLQPEIKKYCAEMQKHIEIANKEIVRIKAMPKFEEMTMEMVYDTYPEIALDPVKRPTFWPHTDDEQIGYVDPTTKVEH